jgi:hypothetical protein
MAQERGVCGMIEEKKADAKRFIVTQKPGDAYPWRVIDLLDGSLFARMQESWQAERIAETMNR